MRVGTLRVNKEVGLWQKQPARIPAPAKPSLTGRLVLQVGRRGSGTFPSTQGWYFCRLNVSAFSRRARPLGFKGSSGGPYVVKDSYSGRSLLNYPNSSENAGSVDGFGGLLVFRAVLVTADTTICARA